jgi:hypothetical protein
MFAPLPCHIAHSNSPRHRQWKRGHVH